MIVEHVLKVTEPDERVKIRIVLRRP